MKDLFANIFEFGGSFRGEYADILYDFVYVPVGFILIFVALLSTLGYYKLFDRPRFHRWWHWLMVLTLTAFVMVIIAILYTNGVINREAPDTYIGNYVDFLIAVFLITAILFFLYSILIKNFSINRRRTPF
jgi:membrane protease YdiL (CAAX protease family)